MNKVCFILRGVPGNGKSTIAEYLNTLANKDVLLVNKSVICCADDYFTDTEGNYNFNINKIHLAHIYCHGIFMNAINTDTPLVIVANTSTRERDVNLYRNSAIEKGYMVFVLTVENWHQGKDVHNVPEDTKIKMKEQLKNSIKL